VLRSPFVPIVGLLLLVGLTSCQAPKGQGMAGPPPPMPVTAAVASAQQVPYDVRVVGSVEPSSRVEIKSQVAGQLMSVHFTEGQNVTEGQLLLKIDPQPYIDAVQQAQATVERDRAQIQQSELARQKDMVQSVSADADAKRFDALAKQRIVSEQQNLQYRTAADSLKESLRGDQAAIESARANLKVDESAVERAKLDLSYCEIHAPIAGRVGNLLVQAGNLVKVNDVPLVVINRIAPVFVSFNVPDKELAAIRQYSAQRKLPVEVTPRDNPSVKASGILSVVDNTADTQTGTIHLKATFDNANGLLWPGEFVNVVLTLDKGVSATVIPAEAVQAGQRGQFVYVVKSDKTVEPRVVAVGRTVDRNVVVQSGLKPGETVVTDGQMLLFPGARVNVVAAPKGDGGVPSASLTPLLFPQGRPASRQGRLASSWGGPSVFAVGRAAEQPRNQEST
jgi:multidrug efflux system membrane fusion protein